MAGYEDWIGSTERREEELAPIPAEALAATLDVPDTAPGAGDPLPLPWQWFYFLPRAPQSRIGHDGHPQKGGFLPPVELPRRMFAGGRMRLERPLTLGRPAVREGEVIKVSEKQGQTGPLVFVTVRYRFLQEGTLCLEEEQDIVYREPGDPVPAPLPAPLPPVAEGAWSRMITPDPVLLFRFSALTFNAHRIHYDRPYAMEEEGYPGLVVHGPLTATLLMELVRLNAGRPAVGFSFRGRAPLFDLAPFRTVGTRDGDTVTLEAQGPDGKPAMTAEATLG